MGCQKISGKHTKIRLALRRRSDGEYSGWSFKPFGDAGSEATGNIAAEIGGLCRHRQLQRINNAALQMPELMAGTAMMLRRGTTIRLMLRATIAINCRRGMMVITMHLMRRRGSVLVC